MSISYRIGGTTIRALFTGYLLSIVMLLLIAACTPSNDNVILDEREQAITPTALPPTYVEAFAPITRENVSSIVNLGRLDTAGIASTVFNHTFSPDATRLAGLNNTSLLSWDLLTGELFFTTPRQDIVKIYYAPDKSELYALNDKGLTRIFNATTGISENNFAGHNRYSGAAAFYADEGWLALGGTDGAVKVWDPFERLALVTLDTGSSSADILAFSTDGQWLAIGSRSDSEVQVWDWQARELIARYAHAADRPVRITFSPDGQQLAVGLQTQIVVWSLADNEKLYALTTGTGGSSEVLLYSPSGAHLVNGGRIPNTMVWDTQTGESVGQLPGIGGDRVSAVFSPDGEMLLASVLDGAVTLWDLTQITSETVIRADLAVGGERTLFVDWTNDSYLLTFFDATGPIYIWGLDEAATTDP